MRGNFSLGLTLRKGAAKLELTKLYSDDGHIDLLFITRSSA
jgi:hypothetical protein